MKVKRKLKKNFSALESYVNWKRPVTDSNPRAYSREVLYDSIKGIEIATKKYNDFQKLIKDGVQIRRASFKFDGEEYTVNLFYDLTANVLGEKYKDKIHPKGYVELPDDFGYATLADFYGSVQRKEFEFGDSARNPEKWLQEFTKKLIISEDKNITDEYEQDLEDNLFNTFIVPAGVTGKDFTKFLFDLQKYNKNIYTILKQAYANRFGSESVENGLVEPFWNTLEEKVSEIIKEERQRNKHVDKASIRDRLYNLAKQFPDIDFTATKTTLTSLMMLSAAAFGFFAKDKPDKVSADDTPDKDTSSRQSGDYNIIENTTYKEIYVTSGHSAKFDSKGEKMVYISSYHYGNHNVNITDLENVNYKKLVISGNFAYPDWSPDNSKIVASDFETNDIFIMNSDGTNINTLASGYYPTWSPDGKEIAFVEYEHESSNIYTINVNNKELTRLTNFKPSKYGIVVSGLDWSPDGNEIVFDRFTEYEGYHIYKIKSNGDNVEKLTTYTQFNVYPTWNANGTKIGFVSQGIELSDESDEGFYVMNSDGTNLKFVTKQIPVFSGQCLDWSGPKVSFESLSTIRYIDLSKPILNEINFQKGDYLIHLTDTHVWRNSNRVDDFVSYVNALNKKPKAVLITGDVVDWGGGDLGAENFGIFFQTINELDSDVKVYFVPGNHDCRNGLVSTSIPIPLHGDKFENYYAMTPTENELTTGMLDLENIVVIGLNSGWDELNSFTSPFPPEGSGLSDTQISSLEEKLDSLDGIENGMDISGKEKIIMMHHPTFWKNEDGADDGVFLHNRNEFRELCKQYGVDIVLAGHTHESDIKEVAGTKYVVTAAGGEDAAFRKITYTKNDLVVGDTEFFRDTITGSVNCPATIAMYDAFGNEVSKDKQELPGAFYSGWELNQERTEVVSAYKGNNYYFVVSGTGTGQVKFLMNKNGETVFETEPLLITKSTKYKLTPFSDKVKVEVDRDLDGKYEKSLIVSDGELTAKDLRDAGKSTEKEDNMIYYMGAGAAAVIGGAGLSILYLQRRTEKPKNSEDFEEDFLEEELKDEEEIIDLRYLLEEE